MKPGVLDTNVLLRFLLQDHPTQSPAATALFLKADKEGIDLHLPDAILAEVTFVMEKFYRKSRVQVADALRDLIQNPWIALQNAEVTNDALLRYRNHPVDFPDALMAASSVAKQVTAVSFDRDLDRFPDVSRQEP